MPDEEMRDTYLRLNKNNRLKALIKACGDGHLGAVMALSPLVDNVNKGIQFDG